MQKNIWVEVNINIGTKNLKIQIRRGQSIQEVVKKFINQFKLAHQYQDIIVNMIKQRIKLKLNQQQNQKRNIQKHHLQQNNTQLAYEDQHKPYTLNNQKNQSIIKKQNKILAQMMKIKNEVNRKREAQLQQIKKEAKKSIENILSKSEKQMKNTQFLKQNAYKVERTASNISKNYSKENGTIKNKKLHDQDHVSKEKIQNNFIKSKSNPKQKYQYDQQSINKQQQKRIIEDKKYSKKIFNQFDHNKSNNKNQNKKQTKIKNKFAEQQQKTNKSSINQQKEKNSKKIHTPEQKNKHSINNASEAINISQMSEQVNGSKMIKNDIIQLKSLLSLHNQNNDNSHIKTKVISNSKIEGKDDQNKNKSIQQVYSKWKKMQQNRRIQEIELQKSKLKRQKQKSNHRHEKHQDDFFYQKGMVFLKEKNKNTENKFKELYPFQPNKIQKQHIDVNKLTQRLYNEAHLKSERQHIRNIENKKIQSTEMQLKYDPIKEKIRKRDQQYDAIISDLIQEGQLRNKISIQSRSVSPFRKTIF